MSVVSASFRSRVRAGVEPIARLFGRVGLTPNSLTVIGLAIAVVGAWFAANQAWLIAGLVVAFGAIFDLFDGALARTTNRTSNFGAFLDSTLDRAGEGVVYIGIVWGLTSNPGSIFGGPALAAAALISGYMVSYSRARAESLGFSPGTGMASVGFAPREVRMSILVVGLILTGLVGGVSYSLSWPNSTGDLAMYGSLGLITLLSTIAAIQRILFTYNQSRSHTQEVNH